MAVTDPSGQTSEGLGHEGGVLLMSAEHQFNGRIEQGCEHAVDLGAGDPEHMRDPVGLQGLHQEFRAVHGCC